MKTSIFSTEEGLNEIRNNIERIRKEEDMVRPEEKAIQNDSASVTVASDLQQKTEDALYGMCPPSTREQALSEAPIGYQDISDDELINEFKKEWESILVDIKHLNSLINYYK